MSWGEKQNPRHWVYLRESAQWHIRIGMTAYSWSRKRGKEGWWPMVGVYMSTLGWVVHYRGRGVYEHYRVGREVGCIRMNPPGSCRSANIWNSISQSIFHILLNLWSIQLVKITDNKNMCNQIQAFSWEEMQLGLIPGSLVCLVATFLGNYPPGLRLKFGR